MRSVRRETIAAVLVLCGTAGCGPRTTVEHLAPDVLVVSGPDSTVRLGDASHPGARYRLSTLLDPSAEAPLHDLVMDVACDPDDWTDAELHPVGDIDGRTVDVLTQEPVTCGQHVEDDLVLALLDLLFPTPACRAQYVVPLPNEVLTAWPDGFTLSVGATSGRTWSVPVTALLIDEHLTAVRERASASQRKAESADR